MKRILAIAFYIFNATSSYASSEIVTCTIKGENVVFAKKCSFTVSEYKSCSLGYLIANTAVVKNETELNVVARPLIEFNGRGEYVASVELSYLNKNGSDALGFHSRVYANSSRDVFNGTFEAECRTVGND
jgi:hypothetical protein